MDSILTSVKKLLGIEEDYTHFDADIIMHINTVFMILNQLGVGPEEGFSITDKTSVWDDYIADLQNFEAVKSYMFLKVKMLFDPPTGSAVTESYNRTISELESRLSMAADLNSHVREEDIQRWRAMH